jgi:hypothetical protein
VQHRRLVLSAENELNQKKIVEGEAVGAYRRVLRSMPKPICPWPPCDGFSRVSNAAPIELSKMRFI